jgi:hypothetical protein
MGRTKAIPGNSFLKGPIGALFGIGLACAVATSWPIILEVGSCSAAYADEVGNKTPFEEAIVQRLRLTAAIGAQEPATAAKALDALRAGFGLNPDQEISFTQAIAEIYYKAKDYQAAATWIDRYFFAGGTDLSMRSLLAQAYLGSLLRL